MFLENVGIEACVFPRLGIDLSRVFKAAPVREGMQLAINIGRLEFFPVQFSVRPSVLLEYFFRATDLLPFAQVDGARSEEHTSELQSRVDLVFRLLLDTT